MSRLYLQIYLTVIGVLVLFAVLGSIAHFAIFPHDYERDMLGAIGETLAETLPDKESPAAEQQVAVERLASRFEADLALHAADGQLVAAAGKPVPRPRLDRESSGYVRSRRGGRAVVLLLPDDRWLVARVGGQGWEHSAWLWGVVLLALAIGLGAYPIARRITRRLEKLQLQADGLAAGDLGVRVEVEGKDEIAELAKRFNRAADRIEQLVAAKSQALASASHELRSPLARMRVAVELLGGVERQDVRERLDRDIEELDELIGELLLASRLDAQDELEETSEVDVLGLLAEEAARIDIEVEGEPVQIRGDGRMLRRLLRNLLENAVRHGQGSPIEASVAPLDGGGALVCVSDRGPGVPEELRDRIFEPFYRPPGMRESVDAGVGLGLALVRQIARHHGGEARCSPREGGGTRFEVELPGA
jgi:signal transduction histidine kinase